MRAVVLLACLLAVCHAQVRTALPQYTFIEYGLFDCSSAGGGCAGNANGVIRAWIEFDATTNLMINYREDAILNNTYVQYNRELATAATTHEYSLLTGTHALVCNDMHQNGTFDRFWLASATYVGNSSVVRGIPVWTFTGTWQARGVLAPYTAWVSQIAPNPIVGWKSQGLTYYYLSYESWSGFPADTFVAPADVPCGVAPPPPAPAASEGVPALKVLGQIFSAVVAFEHLYFLILEMILWRGRARKIFKTTEEYANSTAGLAANQGLYNGFLTAGIVYGMAADDLTLLTFSLACVVVAGVFGALTVGVRIFFVQAVPAIFALFFVQFGYKSASTFSTSHPFITLVWVLLGVLVGGVVLGVYVCLRERGFKATQGLADREAPSSAANQQP